MKKNLLAITTDSGFKCTINPDSFDDWEWVELLATADETPLANEKLNCFVVNRFLSKEDSAALKEYCRDADTGIIKASKVSAEVVSIVTKVQETRAAKNSKSSPAT